MRLKVPPVIVFFISIGMVFGIFYLTKDYSYTFVYRTTISRLFLATGVFLGISGILAFRSNGTTTDPTKPDQASQLVTSGIYQFTRNPMYLGLVLVILGGSIRTGNPFTLLGVFFCVWYLTQFQIKPEEETLETLFGQEYKDYCMKVRRWI